MGSLPAQRRSPALQQLCLVHLSHGMHCECRQSQSEPSETEAHLNEPCLSLWGQSAPSSSLWPLFTETSVIMKHDGYSKYSNSSNVVGHGQALTVLVLSPCEPPTHSLHLGARNCSCFSSRGYHAPQMVRCYPDCVQSCCVGSWQTATAATCRSDKV